MLAWLMFATQTPATGSGRPPWFDMLPFLALPILLMVFMFRSARRQERDRQAMVTTLTKGDEVLTSAGIYGTLISVNETKDEVVIKVDDGTRLRMTKGSVQRNITREEAAKAAQPAKT